MENTEALIENSTYERLIVALATLPANLEAGENLRDGIFRTLGEIGNVWPASVLEKS